MGRQAGADHRGESIYRGRKGWGDSPVAVVDDDHVYTCPKGWGDAPIASIHENEVYRGRKGWGDSPIATVEGGGRMSAACAAVFLLLS